MKRKKVEGTGILGARFGSRLAHLMRVNGVSDKDIAELTARCEQSVVMWKQGQDTTFKIVEAVSVLFNVDPSYFFVSDEAPAEESKKMSYGQFTEMVEAEKESSYQEGYECGFNDCKSTMEVEKAEACGKGFNTAIRLLKGKLEAMCNDLVDVEVSRCQE